MHHIHEASHLEFKARGELTSLRGDDMFDARPLSEGVFWERLCQFGSRREKAPTGTAKRDRKQTLLQINTVIVVLKVSAGTQLCVCVYLRMRGCIVAVCLCVLKCGRVIEGTSGEVS